MKKWMIESLFVSMALCFSLTACDGLTDASEIVEMLLEEDTSTEEVNNFEIMQ